ncbi:hypothetical protein CFOL_v3_32795 [Cephalotus follicularis]|uniref:Uncharacterized protein n=1 Tax=Cephalotus follicularis TaxID=3775 RepID=A0A1Q3DAT3_CEPFO|nr:hypothetical protein CFOL_v3_32795 [Cephalotus follicularis]
MESQNWGSDFEDPLEGYLGLSLFPRTLASLPNTPKPNDPDDLNHIHNFLKSMPMQCPNKLLEQAKVIVDNSSDLLESKMLSNLTSSSEDEAVVAPVSKNLQKQRPDLDHKMSQFSLKPNSSQSTGSLGPNWDSAELKDQSVTFERVENSKRELQRQTAGDSTELNQSDLFKVVPRTRRPGKPGLKRTDRYKDRYSELIAVNQSYPNVASQERDFSCSTANTEKRVICSTSQHPVSLEPSLEIAKLNDPVEFVAAFERIENAKREIQRQTGGLSMELDQSNLFKDRPRPHRQGIQGVKKTERYKHRYSENIPPNQSLQQDTKNTNFASQEQDLTDRYKHGYSENIPLNQSLQQDTENSNDASQESDSNVSIANKEKRVNNLFDELLNYEELDKDQVVSLLLDRLEIKPLDPQKLCLPNFEDIRRIDLRDTTRSHTPRNALSGSDINNFLSRIRSSKTPLQHISAESSTSPTPPNNLFSSISLLKKRIMQLNLSNDAFSAHDIDQSPTANAFPSDTINQQSYQVDTGKEFSISKESKSLMIEKNDIAVATMSSVEVAVGDFAGPSYKSENDNSSRLGYGVDVSSSGSHPDMEDNNGYNSIHHVIVNENLTMPDADAHAGTSGPNELDDKMEDMPREVVDFARPDIYKEDASRNNLDSIRSQLGFFGVCVSPPADQSNPAAIEDHATCGLSLHSDSDRHNEKVQESSSVPQEERTSAVLHPSKKCKTQGHSQRQSLSATEDNEVDECLNTAGSGSKQHNGRVQKSSSVPQNEQSDAVSRLSKKHEIKGLPQRQALAVTEDLAIDEHFSNALCGTEQHNEKVQESSSISQNDRSKRSLQRKDWKNKRLNRRQSLAATGDQAVDGCTNTVQSGPEQHNEMVQESSTVSSVDQGKGRRYPHKERRRKELSRRQSLAAVGTHWKSGVRRSTRIKSRPLEFWKGERFLYGRIHQSLATVIGIKYESPTKENGQPALKVKSFVPDKYKKLVDLAALH